MNGMNPPMPPGPEQALNMVAQDVNTGVNLAIKPFNDAIGWFGQAANWVASIPTRAITAFRPGGN